MNVIYTKEVLEATVKDSHSLAEVIRKLGKRFSGGLHGHLKAKLKLFRIDTSHFSRCGCNRGKTPFNKLSWEGVLVKNRIKTKESTTRLRNSLIESGRKYECEKCLIKPVWNGEPLCIQVDHKDGNWRNNTPKNLRFLCPNCHSQTDTFGIKNATVL